jgi:hypothetical protein
MNFARVIEYTTLIAAAVWLVWLASRPFLANLNRLLLVVIGWAIYGYLAKNFVIPMMGILTAHIEAEAQMAKLLKMPNPPEILLLDAPTNLAVVYIGIPLAAFFLLTFWLQRTLARCPRVLPPLE